VSRIASRHDHLDWLASLPLSVLLGVVCGHTHMPFARLANRWQIVNPNSRASDADALAVMAPRDGRLPNASGSRVTW
jgi:predicted phosphodiesterase